MAELESDPGVVVVTGDVIFEWRLVKSKIAKRQPDDAPLVDPRSYLQLSYEPSGAIVLGKMIERVLGGSGPEIFMPRPGDNDQPLRPDGFWVSIALCSQYRMSKAGASDGKAVWRIDKRLGIDRAKMAEIESKWREPGYGGVPYLTPVNRSGTAEDPGSAQLVVLEQGRNGFEESTAEAENAPNVFWPPSLREPKRDAWLLTRWSRPGAPNEKKLWRHVHDRFGGRIVAVITADHLRYIGARVTRNLSWERTVEDLFHEIGAKWAEIFEGCRYLIVSLLPTGAVIFERTGTTLHGKLIYDRENLDASWSEAYGGEMMGYNRCLTAAVAAAIIRPPRSCSDERRTADLSAADEDPNLTVSIDRLTDGVVAGLVASRCLLARGFQAEQFEEDPRRQDAMLPKRLLFPVDDVAKVIHDCLFLPKPSDRPSAGSVRAHEDFPPSAAYGWNISSAELDQARRLFDKPVDFEPPNRSGSWSILASELHGANVLSHARGIIEWGRRYNDDIVRFPLLRVGNLVVIDRMEMEGLRTVQSLMKDYVGAPFVSKPLSIAVFGPAGSGKSFAITELARGLGGTNWPGQPLVESLTFNLSQFTSPKSVSSALQQVRDASLAGKTALVFWDEFDTHFEIELGWLRYFLGPMQDGRFQDGSMTYHVGRAIFVFAGSMFPTQRIFANFVNDELRQISHDEDRSRHGRHRATADDQPHAKSPDFMSRLVGFVDVPTLDHSVRGHVDSSVALRRAGLLRSFLRQEVGEPLLQYVRDPKDARGDDHLRRRINVDQGVADAFLRVQRFNYNARSIEAIVKMSTLRGKDAYERSSLPPRAQLALHVDPDEFLNYVATGPRAAHLDETVRDQGVSGRR
ncbi:MAG TPA: hypothetical protein VK669_12770 [Candidatus Limnocylindrales bacterium]|nr:hypothetical protein [Candidatus Limnocylindrales bacterium]